MKKDGIQIMLVGLTLTILTAYFYFSKHYEVGMSKFVLTIGNSFHFNWAPMIGISIMALGEFILWESQTNMNMNDVRTKFKNKFYIRISTLRLKFIYLSNLRLINMKVVKYLVTIFNF